MIYVGIDVASEKHDFMIMNEEGEFISKKSISIPNTDIGFIKLHNTVQSFCEVNNDYQVRIGLESTGFYHQNILFYLLDNKAVFKPYTLKAYHTEALKSLSRERFYIIEELRKVKIDIYRLLTQLFPEYLKLFSSVYQGSALAIISKYPSPSKLAKAYASTLKQMLHGRCSTTAEDILQVAKNSTGNDSAYLSFSLAQAIKTLEFYNEKIVAYDEIIRNYVNRIDSKITSIPGIGYTTAGLLLGEIGDISRFKNAEHLLSFAGLDIEVYESGKYKAKNHRISKKGSKYLRYALYQAAKVCWRFDSMFNAYYEKKKAENKHFYVIAAHLQKKIVKVIFAILKSNKTYTPH